MTAQNAILLLLLALSPDVRSGEVTGTIQQILDGQTIPAKGRVSVGINNTVGTQLDPLKPAGEASVARRIAIIGPDGHFSVPNVPEGQPLYIDVFLNPGLGKYVMANLTAGQILDVSQVIPDTKVNGVSFTGKIAWPAGVAFKEKTTRFLTLIGKDNNWEYLPIEHETRDETFDFKHIQPGVYRLGIHATLANGDDRYDEVEITVAKGMADPFPINIPNP